MKKLIFGFALAASWLSIPLSAQYNNCCPTQCDPCSCDEMDFEGLYIGGNIGVITHLAHRNDYDGFLASNGGWSSNDTNFTAGVQLGYDWLCCNTLLGLVVDWNWVNNSRTLQDNLGNRIRPELNWFTTIRARAGLAICDTLLYITGGAAVTRHETRWTSVAAPAETFNFHNTKWGWTGGFGAEFKLMCNFTLGAEFLFMHFDENRQSRVALVGAVPTTFNFGSSNSSWVGRILLNYRFGDLCSCFW